MCFNDFVINKTNVSICTYIYFYFLLYFLFVLILIYNHMLLPKQILLIILEVFM